MEDCCFAWTKRNCEKKGPNLEEIDLHIKGGSLVAVAGTVGSGKSSLLSAITGHMTHLGGRIEINVSGIQAYVLINLAISCEHAWQIRSEALARMSPCDSCA
ncbi:hypothetical protein HPB48_009287 [Haemaphysalis longicornis]|uniref:ABC transporter domain-containing protein n=1 Tax=Haemaphysalis longicornis TaxID=44386 RepID=A0A9J6H2H2_HAELO|nr:hypothetical protein HPB48_009287 [Haemaphysalis longicornis]